MRLKNIFGEQEIYQLHHPQEAKNPSLMTSRLGGCTLSGTNITFGYLTLRFSTGAEIYAVQVKDVAKMQARLKKLVPLFLITPEKVLTMWTADSPPSLQETRIDISHKEEKRETGETETLPQKEA